MPQNTVRRDSPADLGALEGQIVVLEASEDGSALLLSLHDQLFAIEHDRLVGLARHFARRDFDRSVARAILGSHAAVRRRDQRGRQSRDRNVDECAACRNKGTVPVRCLDLARHVFVSERVLDRMRDGSSRDENAHEMVRAFPRIERGGQDRRERRVVRDTAERYFARSNFETRGRVRGGRDRIEREGRLSLEGCGTSRCRESVAVWVLLQVDDNLGDQEIVVCRC